MSDFEHDKQRELLWMPFVKDELKKLGWTMVDAEPLKDLKEATDLVRVENGSRVAVRTREAEEYYQKYKWEFTVRALRHTGAKTEYEKIVDDGYGDFMFYCFITNQLELMHWWFVNLNVFRQAMTEHHPIDFGKTCNNHDGTYFWAFDVRRFSKRGYSILYATHQRVAAQAIKEKRVSNYVMGRWP